MLANLKKAAFDRETIKVGGGEFNHAEIKNFVCTIEEMAALLEESRALGLTFDCGTAYIRRGYIDKQEALKARISEVLKELNK